MTTNHSILIAEDDRAVRESLERALRVNGYTVRTATDGLDALAAHADDEPDLLITDVMMPNLDGLTVCKRLRESGDKTPILVLTARDAVSDRVAGLDAGADDYLPKPFALEELLARVRALLRRHGDAAAEVLTFADLTLDTRSRQVLRGEVTLELTKTEFDLLELLLRNAGVVLSRDVIYERIWGYDFGTDSKSLDVYIGYLRRKTEDGGAARLIHTVRGVGYVLRDA